MTTDSNATLQQFVNQPYKYGFSTDVEIDTLPPGLNEKIIRNIIKKNNEPDYMFDFRVSALKKWRQMKSPTWSIIQLQRQKKL